MARAYFYCKPGTGTATGDGGRYTSQKTGTWSSAFTATTEYYSDPFETNSATTKPVAGDVVICADTNLQFGAVHYKNSYTNEGISFYVVDEDVDITVPIKSSVINLESTSSAAYEYYVPGASQVSTTSVQRIVHGINVKGGHIFFANRYSENAIFIDTTFNLCTAAGQMRSAVNLCGGTLLALNADIDANTTPTSNGGILAQYRSDACYVGGSISVEDYALKLASYSGDQTFVAVDFSGSTTGADLIVTAGSTVGLVLSAMTFHGCKLWTSYGEPDIGEANLTVVVSQCTSTWQWDFYSYAGSIKTDNTVYYTSDSFMPDGTTKISFAYEATNASDTSPLLPVHKENLRWIVAENNESATKTKVRVHIATLTGETIDTKDLWVLAIYPDATNPHELNFIKQIVGAIDSGASLSTETGKWTGAGLGTQYYVELTMTSPGDGPVMVMVGFTNASNLTSKQIHVGAQLEFVA